MLNAKALASRYLIKYKRIGYLFLLGGIVFVDYKVKEAIDTEPKANFPRKLPSCKHITVDRLRNKGLMFSTFEDIEKEKLADVQALAVLIYSIVYAYNLYTKSTVLRRFASTCVMAGGIGNLIDRKKKGYVVDFIQIKHKPFDKVIFNISDVFIFLGMLLYIIDNKKAQIKIQGD